MFQNFYEKCSVHEFDESSSPETTKILPTAFRSVTLDSHASLVAIIVVVAVVVVVVVVVVAVVFIDVVVVVVL